MNNHSRIESDRLKRIFTNLIGVLIIALLGWYLYKNRDVFNALRFITWQQVLIIVLIDALAIVTNSLINFTMIQRLDPCVSYLDCFLLQYTNNFLNKFLPTIGGGAAFRAIYLKKKYKFPYSHFLSTLAGIYVIYFFVIPIIGLACLLLIYIQTGAYNWVLILGFLGLFLPSLIIITFSPNIPESPYKIVKLIRNTVDGWKLVKNNPNYILIYGILSVTLSFLTALINLVLYNALSGNTNLLSMIYLSTLNIAILFLNFTPGGIGIKEGIYIFSADLVQIPDDILVLGSLVLHGITIMTSLLFGGISYFMLMRRLGSKENK